MNDSNNFQKTVEKIKKVDQEIKILSSKRKSLMMDFINIQIDAYRSKRKKNNHVE